MLTSMDEYRWVLFEGCTDLRAPLAVCMSHRSEAKECFDYLETLKTGTSGHDGGPSHLTLAPTEIGTCRSCGLLEFCSRVVQAHPTDVHFLQHALPPKLNPMWLVLMGPAWVFSLAFFQITPLGLRDCNGAAACIGLTSRVATSAGAFRPCGTSYVHRVSIWPSTREPIAHGFG